MKSTARNQFAGTVTAVQAGPVSTEVAIGLKGGQEIVAAMTAAAAKRLKLKKGVEAVALVKASSIVLMTDLGGYRLSARNQLEGAVSRIDRGAVSSLVVVTLPGGTAVSATLISSVARSSSGATLKDGNSTDHPLMTRAKTMPSSHNRWSWAMMKPEAREMADTSAPSKSLSSITSRDCQPTALRSPML
jgi:molybdopterin-binding protein